LSSTAVKPWKEEERGTEIEGPGEGKIFDRIEQYTYLHSPVLSHDLSAIGCFFYSMVNGRSKCEGKRGEKTTTNNNNNKKQQP